MDLRRLEYFLAVVDHGGFTKAAQAVPVSQPALSQAIRELESELGAALFERIGRGVVLTEAGRALIAPARQARRDVDAAREAVAAVVGLDRGRLEVTALPTLAADPLGALVGEFRQRHPGVVVSLAAPDGSTEVLTAVRSGAADVGLTERPDRELPAITVHQLHDQELLAVLPPDAVAAHRGIAMADLARRALVATPPGTSTRRLLDEAFSSAGVDPTIAVETAQREAILPLVLAGAGAALLPRPLAETAAALGAVVRPLRPKVVRSVVLIHRTGTLAPAAQAFVTLAGRLARGREDAAAPNLAAHRSRR